MVTYRDVLIRRSAWMRERSDAREVGSPLAAAGYIALRCPAARKPRVSIHGHPLGGAKHASPKDTAEPMYPGGSRDDSFTLRGRATHDDNSPASSFTGFSRQSTRHFDDASVACNPSIDTIDPAMRKPPGELISRLYFEGCSMSAPYMSRAKRLDLAAQVAPVHADDQASATTTLTLAFADDPVARWCWADTSLYL